MQYGDMIVTNDDEAKSISFALLPVTMRWEQQIVKCPQLGVFINRFGERLGFDALLARLRSESPSGSCDLSKVGTACRACGDVPNKRRKLSDEPIAIFTRTASDDAMDDDVDAKHRTDLNATATNPTSATVITTTTSIDTSFPTFRILCNVIGAALPFLEPSFAQSFQEQVDEAVRSRIQHRSSAFGLALKVEQIQVIARTLLHCCHSAICCWLCRNALLTDSLLPLLRYVFDCEADDTEWPISGMALKPVAVLLHSFVARPDCVAFLLSRGAVLNVQELWLELTQLESPGVENVPHCKECGLTYPACKASRTLCHASSHYPMTTDRLYESVLQRRKRLTQALALRKAYTDGLLHHIVEALRFRVLAELTAGYLSADAANR